ncbi:MAG TPA: response regulator transcription factor [Acidimicrobiales bacterium]|nr:response regulator transcription factor [Acidimicrobiales bacterium]
MARVLVVDDDPALLRALRLGLGAAGHEVIIAPNGQEGLAQALRSAPEVVVLDLGLPDTDGLTVCERLRGWSEVPIIVLSATGTEDRKVAALDGGADDYVTKPFGMAELEARIRAVLRHRRVAADDQAPEAITVGPLSVDTVQHAAHLHDTPLELTSKEFDVLAFLAAHAGKVCTHQMILTAVWGNSYTHEAQYLHAYVHRLRQKLGDQSGLLLKSAPGIGYSLSTDPHVP